MISLEELSKLDEAGAMELLLAYTTDIRRHDKDIEVLEKDRQLWDSRVRLAEGKGMAELAQGAKAQLSRIEASLSGIVAARDELKLDASRIREALPAIKARRRSIDPDLLQAELSMLLGEEQGSSAAKLDEEFKALEGKAEGQDPLDRLKRKMGLGPSSGPKPEDPQP